MRDKKGRFVKGYKLSKEEKEKLKGKVAWNKGKKMKDLIPNYINPFKGKKPSKESIELNRKAHIGKKATLKQLEALKIGQNMKITHSKESKLKNSIAHRGSNNSRWKGGCSKWRGYNWNKIRKEVLKRDNYKCVICGNKAEVCHHKMLWKIKKTYNKNMIISLCRSCHMKEHYKEIEGGKNARK